MKVLVLAALVALALAASPKWERRQASRVSDSSFRSGREYRYAFDGQVATGLPQASEQHAATRLQADAVIRFQGQKTVLLQLQNVRFGAASRKIAEPREIQPFELFEEQEPSQEHKQKLELPCRFQYENGLVSQIVFDGEDNAWSENIKRSVLNILQVNLQKNERTDQQETRLLRRDEESSEQTADFFTAAELTLEGNCEVSYTVTEQQDRENRQPTLFVSKAINFDKCKERTDIRYNYRFGEQCSTCDKKYDEQKQSMEFSTVVAYNISGTPEQFLIRQAEVRSQYVLAPLNEKENVIATYVLAKLALLEASDNQNVQEPQGKKQPQPLLYNAEWDKQKEKFHMEGDRSFQQETPYVGIKNKPEIVEKIVVQIVKEMTDEQQGLELETSHQFARLVKVLRMCNEQEIQQIHRQIYEKSQQDRVQQEQIQDILNNALAVAGTKNTIEHVVNKIQDGQISPLQGSQLLKSLVNIRTVSQKHIEIVQNLCKSPAAKRSPLLKQSCQLTLGALVNAICGEHKDQLAREEDEKLCPRELKQQYVQTLVQEYQKASTRYEKILALKTLANAGLDLSVFDLEKIIKDQNEEKAVRMQAIDALRQLRSVMPRKIQSILLPVFKNKWEHADVRMTAFAQVMQTLPERHILDQIAVQLQNERSQQVQAFVYNTFLSYANSTNPCEQQLAEDVQLSLRLVRVPQPETLGTSNFGKISGYSENLKAGWFLNGGAIFSNDSVLPKEVMASLDAVLGGQWNKYLVQIGASQQNLDQVLQKVLRKVQQEGFDQVVVRGKRSSSFQPTELLRGLVEKLSIKSRRQDSEDPHALLYIRYKDLDYAVIPIDEETISDSIKQAIRNGVFDLGNFERMLAQGYQFSTTVAAFFYETSRKIPTSLGLPLQINGKIPTVATIDGQVKVELQPKDSQKLNGVKLNIQAQPQIVSTHITKMECWSPIVNSGIKLLHSVQLNLPVDASIQVVVDKQLQIKASFKAVEMKKRVAVVQTRPVLFYRTWPKAPRNAYTEPKEKTIYPEAFEKQTRECNREYGQETVGVKVSVVGHLHQHPFTSVEGAPLPILAGNNHLEVFIQPTQDTPREFVFEAIVEPYAESVSKVEIQKNDFEQFYSKKTQRMYESSSQESQEEDFFDTESHEQEQTNEQQRRQHYNRRVQNYESGKGYKHRINLKAKAVGGSIERRAETLIEATCNEEGHYCQLRVKAQRSPIQPETRQWTFEMNAQALYPEQPESFEQLKQQAHREFTGKINAVWGDDKTSRVDIQIQGEQNREQKRWMRRVEGQQSGIEQHDALIEASFLNQYKIDIKHKLQPQSQYYINWCYQTLKARYYWNSQQQLAQNEQGQTQCILTIDPETRQYANLTIAAPFEQLTLKEIRLPMQVGPRARSQVKSNPTSLRQYVKGVAKNQGAECTAKTQKIETFDNVVYKAPLTTCYSVLAKDCATANPTFAVLMKKINKNAEEKKMKIIDENDVIEIEYNGEKFTTKVNGKKQEQKQIEIQNGQITKKGDVVVVDLEDVTVHFDGYTAKIQLSQLFQNQQCGLCGHYDGEQEDELRRADNELTDDLEDFHRSFLAQDEECDIEESVVSDKKNYKLYDSEEQNSEEDEDDWESEQPRRRQQNRQQGRQQQQEPSNSRRNQNGQRTKRPIETTRVIEYNHRVCFSKEAVAECPRKSHPEEQTEKKVKFACIERSHPEAQRLARLANKQVVDVDAYPDSFVEPIQVPTTCLAF